MKTNEPQRRRRRCNRVVTGLFVGFGLLGLSGFVAGGSAADNQGDETTQQWSEESIDLRGDWSVRHTTTTETTVPVAGSFSTVTESRLAASIVGDKTDLDVTTRVCSVEMETDLPMVEMVVPDAFVEGLPERTRHAVYRPEDQKFVMPPVWETLGIELDDPATDTLPEDLDDPRIIDQDGNGHPGTTLRIEGMVDGEIHLVRRGWEAWYGEVVGPDAIEGRIEWTTEQHVIDASRWMLRRQPEANPHPADDRHHFRLERIDDECASSPDCGPCSDSD